jgi:hypothetical protein
MKKYLLTVIGDFKSQEELREIALALSPIVDSQTIKYQYTKGVLICHFASEMDMKDIHEFLEITSYELYDSFILSEFNDKVSVFMPQDYVNHLFNLEDGGEINDRDVVLIPKNNTQHFDEDEDEEFVALLLDEVKKQLKPPSLDQLLEKIKNKGIESLTPFEKGTLENYSKN